MALSLLLLPFAGRMRRVSGWWKGRAWVVVLALAGVVFAGGLTACGGGNGGSSGAAVAEPANLLPHHYRDLRLAGATTSANLTVR